MGVIGPDYTRPASESPVRNSGLVRIRYAQSIDTAGIRNYRVCMRTTLDLPDELIEQARIAVGFKSKTDTVVFALREVVRRQRIDELKSWMGKTRFEFDPTEIRKTDRQRARRRRS